MINLPEQISELLDIFIITYNREAKLNRTLDQIFSSNSPVKDFTIEVIDNNSTDNTRAIVQKYQTKFPNLKYRKNKYNISGNANIARTFELAEKEYIWILCDDDEYDWSAWNEVETAILRGDDCIIVADTDYPEFGIEQIYAQTSFLPGAIYKMSNFDETLIDNMQYNISNMFPHMAFSSKLINENKKFTLISSPIVIYKRDEIPLEQTYVRGTKEARLHPYRANLSYSAGYANTLMLIKDKKLRKKLAEKRRFFTHSLTSASLFFENEQKYNGSVYNLFCIFNCLSVFQKIRFIINWILFWTVYRILFIYLVEDYDKETDEIIKMLKMRIFTIIKTKLLTFRVKNKELHV